MKNCRKLLISAFFGCFMLIHIAGAAEISLLIENNDGEQVQLSVLDKALMEAALEDMAVQYHLYGEKLSKRDVIDGAIKHKGVEYGYAFVDGELSIYSDKQKTINIPVRMILEAIVQAEQEHVGVNRCPWCIIAGIIVAQGSCAASAGGEHLYCQMTCECGVSSVETTCVLGYRRTSCSCFQCPQDPTPGSLYPIPGGGSLFGTPWIDNNNDPNNGYPLCVNPTIDGNC